MKHAEHNAVFLEYITRHAGILHRVSRCYAEGKDETEELFQELLIAVWKAVPAFRGDASPSTFMYRVATNCALSWRRAKRTQSRRFQPLNEDHADDRACPDDQTLVDRLYAAIRQLAEAERALALLYLDELSYREIANVLGISESNVGVRINRLKKKLVELFGEA